MAQWNVGIAGVSSGSASGFTAEAPSVVLKNLSPSVTVFVGGAAGASTGSYPLLPGEVLKMDVDASQNINMITAAGSADVSYIRFI